MEKYIELEKIAELKRNWIINEEEFQIEKEKILKSGLLSKQILSSKEENFTYGIKNNDISKLYNFLDSNIRWILFVIPLIIILIWDRWYIFLNHNSELWDVIIGRIFMSWIMGTISLFIYNKLCKIWLTWLNYEWQTRKIFIDNIKWLSIGTALPLIIVFLLNQIYK